MKKLLSTLLGSSLLATSVISLSSTSALAAPGSGQTATTCNIDNIFASVACLDAPSGDNQDQGSDLDNWLDGFFGQNASITNLGGADKSNNKIEGYNGNDDYYSISSGSGTLGTITFNQDINSAFSFVLKASTTWSAYLFDTGVKAGDTLNWVMDGVAKNANGNAAQLSHASLFLTDIAAKPAPVEQPPVEQPPVEQPPVSEQPPVEQPPVSEQPPVEEPPVEEPPVEEPPVAVLPPVEEPPVEEPPVEEPPVSEQPPVEQPPVAEQPDEPVAVPEPGTLAGLALVAAALGFSKRKQA
jgi:hypothetical protein